MRSQFILCVSYYYRRSIVPFKALCTVSTGQILDRGIKRGYLSIYLPFPGRWIVTVVGCNYLKPVSKIRLLTYLVEIFNCEIFVNRVSLEEEDKIIR